MGSAFHFMYFFLFFFGFCFFLHKGLTDHLRQMYQGQLVGITMKCLTDVNPPERMNGAALNDPLTSSKSTCGCNIRLHVICFLQRVNSYESELDFSLKASQSVNPFDVCTLAQRRDVDGFQKMNLPALLTFTFAPSDVGTFVARVKCFDRILNDLC